MLKKRLGELRYAGRNETLSATVNKYLAENGLLETEEHSLYGLRNSFKDRLTETGVSDTVETTLMGHKFDRPNSGKGPSMVLKQEWMERMVIELVARTSLIIGMFGVPGTADCHEEEHSLLLRAFKQRHEGEAAQLMIAHLKHLEMQMDLTSDRQAGVDLVELFNSKK